MSDTLERVKKIIVRQLGVDIGQVTNKALLAEDLGADSLDAIELEMAFEREFGVQISSNIAERILTVGDAVRFIEKPSETSRERAALQGREHCR